MIINAKITGITYTPFLCPNLPLYQLENLGQALNHESVFSLQTGHSTVAVSSWVSPKRTRSYPYARVYNTLMASKKITIIPFVKDEGKDGDRDFIQWDTISLMSLLGVNVIIAYYSNAEKSKTYENKITEKRISEIKNATFQFLSRENAKSAQQREINTVQPKEYVQADIKDGLIKMMLYSNFKDVSICGKIYVSKPILKLTSGKSNGISDSKKHS